MINKQFILEATGGELKKNTVLPDGLSFSIDSRSIRKDEVFIALKGDNFDGHDYIKEAFNKGASAAIAEHVPEGVYDKPVIKVRSTEKALRDLAQSWRNSFSDLKLVAITGSNGKTTTKEMTHSILSVSNNVLKNSGNFNNHIGLPLTLLKLEKAHNMCVLELGMNDFGEIRNLTEICIPDTGAITNIGRAHLEKLGSVDGVAKAKGELVENFGPDNTFCVNADDQRIMKIAENCRAKKIFFGLEYKDSVLKISDIEKLDLQSIKFRIQVEGKSADTRIRGIGSHNIMNALCASTIAYSLGCGLHEIQAGLERYSPSQMRMEVIETPFNFSIINDSYNANPESVSKSIEELSTYKKDNKLIAILGDMLELGEASEREHENIGKKLSSSKIDYVITMGEKSKSILKGINGSLAGFQAENHAQASRLLLEIAGPGDVVLIKGSRGMKMENIIQNLYKA